MNVTAFVAANHGTGHRTDAYCQKGLVPGSNRVAVVSFALILEPL